MRSIVTILLASCVMAPTVCAQEIICVNGSTAPPLDSWCRDHPNAQGVHCAEAQSEAITGIDCWDNAYIDLQDALDEAAALADQGSIVEVWVAAGTYNPDRGTGNRTMSYSLHKNVELYGGFAGWETFRDQRDFVINATILSGDLNDDDDPDGSYVGGTSNCCTEHGGPGCDDPECEEIVSSLDPPGPRSCLIRWDVSCRAKAAQLCCNLCSTRSDCDNSLHVLVANDTDITAIIDGFTITSGRADSIFNAAAGGIFIQNGGATLRNCIIRENVARAATAIVASNSEVLVQGCRITGNYQLPLTFTAAFMSAMHSSITIEDSVFAHNDGPGLTLQEDRGTIRRTTFLENKGTAVNVWSRTSAIFDECRFIRNVTHFSVSSGGIDNTLFSFVLAKNCQFIGNVSSGGAGAAMDNMGIAVVYNCLFLGNRSGRAAFFNFVGGSAYLEHCTFVDNQHSGVDVRDGFVELKNCILWNNRTLAGEATLAAQLHVDALFGAARVSYSALQNYDGPDGTFPGLGNTGADPMFVDMDGPDDIPGNEDDNLRLRPDSPLIDAGDPDATLAIDRDLDGHTRLLCDRVDMGPYEFGIGDIDCNGLVNLSDLADWPTCMTDPRDNTTTAPCNAFDFNADGAVDLWDYAALQAIISAP